MHSYSRTIWHWRSFSAISLITVSIFVTFSFLASNRVNQVSEARSPWTMWKQRPGGSERPLQVKAYAAFLAAPEQESDIDDDDVYYVGTRILAYQLLQNPATRTNNSIPFIVLVTDEVKPSKLKQLSEDGARVLQVGRISIPWVNSQLRHQRWRDVLSKLHLFQLTDYERILFLDSDVILTDRMDGVFDDSATQFRPNLRIADQTATDESPQPDEYVLASVSGQGSYSHSLPPRKGRTLNAGFIMLSPSQVLFEHYMSVLSIEGRFDPKWPEQNLWNYVHRHAGNMPFGSIDPVWNVNRVTSRDIEYGIKSLHVKWWDPKEYNPNEDSKLRDFVLSKKWMMEGASEARQVSGDQL